MDHDIDMRPGPEDDRGGLATHHISHGVIIATRDNTADARSPTVSPIQGSIEGLRRRLQAVAGDIDQLWHDALDSQDFKLVTRSVDANQGVHRALLALDDDRRVIGALADWPDDSGRSGRSRPATS